VGQGEAAKERLEKAIEKYGTTTESLPLRLELGPRDFAAGTFSAVRRLDGAKLSVPLGGAELAPSVARALTGAVQFVHNTTTRALEIAEGVQATIDGLTDDSGNFAAGAVTAVMQPVRLVIASLNETLHKVNGYLKLAAIDPAAFGDPAVFRAAVDTLIRDLRASERMPGHDRIWLPGEVLSSV
jgi:hypothetical protein